MGTGLGGAADLRQGAPGGWRAGEVGAGPHRRRGAPGYAARERKGIVNYESTPEPAKGRPERRRPGGMYIAAGAIAAIAIIVVLIILIF